ncbi:LysR substrate-binding domain-containing protein [Cupriavidus sp. WS]|uniref:LysR substrate-binding domain-containing protein n=1 Tax=Cupriavidus sp. WS TaxID=1312922 RepID=UPI00035F89A2|nr:LysR substrate-binding domain-containing protein [Cupriavidus sp. WS]
MSTISSRLPPIHCLLAFEARARLKSGVLVAQELAITPSAVSHRIRQLEDFTRLTLFTKVNGEIILTPDGQSYLETVRSALYALSYFPSSRGRTIKPRAKLRLSSPPTFATQILLPRLGLIKEQFPQLEIDIQLSVPLIGAKAEPADIEIRFGDGRYTGRKVVRILDEQVMAACSPAYAERHGPFTTFPDLLRADLLRCSIEPWRPWFQAAGLDWEEPNSMFQFSDVGLFVDAAAHGMGIALARPTLIQSHLASGRLITLYPATTATPYYAYYATCPPEAYERPEVEGFIEWLEKELNISTPGAYGGARAGKPRQRRDAPAEEFAR